MSGSVRAERTIGRYTLHGEIAAGGMAAIHLGRTVGPGGFSRTVAIKRLHPNYAKDPEFVAMFLDEARVAGRISHPNVVATLDCVALAGELFLVMEFIQGETLSRLAKVVQARGERVPLRVALAVMVNALHGLHAAHEARSEQGEPLNIVHRDVSPQNILVGVDGVARVLDFGVAKAVGRIQNTREGEIKGKLSYMAPEQVLLDEVSQRTDIYAAGVVLWEVLAGRKLYDGGNQGAVVMQIARDRPAPPSSLNPEVPPELDAVVLRALEQEPARRFASAREMALALETFDLAKPSEVGAWVQENAREELRQRADYVSQIEAFPTPQAEPPPRLHGSEDPTLVGPPEALAASPEEPPEEPPKKPPRSPSSRRCAAPGSSPCPWPWPRRSGAGCCASPRLGRRPRRARPAPPRRLSPRPGPRPRRPLLPGCKRHQTGPRPPRPAPPPRRPAHPPRPARPPRRPRRSGRSGPWAPSRPPG